MLTFDLRFVPLSLNGGEANVIVVGPISSSILIGLPKEIHSVVLAELDV